MKRNIGNLVQRFGQFSIHTAGFFPLVAEDLTTFYWVQVHNHASV